MGAATGTKASVQPDPDEIVEQLDYLTTDIGNIAKSLDRIRLYTAIIAAAAGIIILGFVLGVVLGFVGAFEAAS